MKKVVIFDFEFTISHSFDEMAEAIASYDGRQQQLQTVHKRPFLITPNVDDIVNWDKEKYRDLKNEFQRSAFIIPDGQPLVLFSKLIGKSLIRRMTGSTLFPFIWRKIKSTNKKAFLILANKELCGLYEREYPLARAYAPPFFQADDTHQILEIVNACRRVIEEHQPQFVFVGIQFPKQNILALELFKTIQVSTMPLFLILGSSMEYYTGHLKRSPLIFQKIGMEWFYRCCQQPKRLFKRYFVNDIPIIGIFFREACKNFKLN
jgi:N-acetylglucosaminyldiphosphoundecaprenol N-acetyl-beta-D-mannosaminyltransferase